MADPLDTLDSLYSSLDELEDALEPLFAKTLAQTEENLEPEQKAKLQVLLTYVIQDLVLGMSNVSLHDMNDSNIMFS